MSAEGQEFARSFEPEEVLVIAAAVAEREIAEQDAVMAIMAEFSGEEAPDIPGRRERAVDARARFLVRRISDPSYVPTSLEVCDSLQHGTYEVCAEQMSKGYGVEVTFEQARVLVLGAAQSTGGIAELDAQSMEMFAAACTVAKAHGTSVAQVYQNEELYSETVRTTITVEQFAAERVEFIADHSDPAIGATLVHAEEMFMPEEERATMTEEERTVYLMGMQFDDDFQESVQQVAAVVRAAHQHISVAHIVRIWGVEALYTLPAYVQEELGVEKYTQNLGVPKLGGLALESSMEDADQSVMREAFRSVYCAQKDWDANNLTPDQQHELYAQPGWQDPSF